jgi:DNA-binding NtrC family response regulator
LAVFRAAEPGFVLAVVDQTMPGRSGTETIAALHELAPALPAVLMSGYPAKKLVLPNERVTFLQKPMTVDQLQEAIRKVLDRRA